MLLTLEQIGHARGRCLSCKQRGPVPGDGTCACTVDGKDILQHAQAGYCPAGRFGTADKPEGWDAMPPAVPGAPSTPGGPGWEDRARELWGEMHRRALAYAGDAAAELEWLEALARRLPCGDCRTHWRELVAANPPDLRDAERYFAWSVARHNDVNRRLDKPEWTVDEARLNYRPVFPGATVQSVK